MIIEKIPETIKFEKDHLWIKLHSIDSIFRYDFDVQKMSLFSENIKFSDGGNIGSFVETREMLFAFPCYGNQISIYDVNTKSLIKKEILEFDYTYFDNAVVYKESIYVINNDSSNLCILEFDLNEFVFVNKINIDISDNRDLKCHTRILAEDIIIEGDMIYLAGGHSLIKFDMQNKLVGINEIESSIGFYVTMSKHENIFVLSDEFGKCILTNGVKVEKTYDLFEILDDIELEMSQTEHEYMLNKIGYKGTYMAFNHSFLLEDVMYLIPGRASAVVTYDFKNNCWGTMFHSNNIVSKEWGEPFKKKIKDSCCMYVKDDLIYDFEKKEFYQIKVDKEKSNIAHDGIIKESLGYFNSLDAFVYGI